MYLEKYDPPFVGLTLASFCLDCRKQQIAVASLATECKCPGPIGATTQVHTVQYRQYSQLWSQFANCPLSIVAYKLTDSQG